MFKLRYSDAPEHFASVMHMQTARRLATEAAHNAKAVEILASGKVRLVIQPDGTATAPESVEVHPRARCAGVQPCFCMACREDRRLQRAAGSGA